MISLTLPNLCCLVLGPPPDTSFLLASMTSVPWPLPGLSLLFSKFLLINLLVKGWYSQSFLDYPLPPPPFPHLEWMTMLAPTASTPIEGLMLGFQTRIYKLVLTFKLNNVPWQYLRLSIIKSKPLIFHQKSYLPSLSFLVCLMDSPSLQAQPWITWDSFPLSHSIST